MLPIIALLAGLLVAGVGVVDAGRSGDSDTVVLLTALILLQGMTLLALLHGRRGVALRPDLSSWLRRQASATGEPADHLADRCVAAYRAGLLADREVVP